MLSLLRIEFLKTRRLLRTGIGYAAILVVVPLILLGLHLSGRGLEQEFLRGLADQFFVVGRILNGYTAAIIVMNFLWVHVPFLITLVAGDIVSGEANRGTFRVLLTRRPSRARVLLAKYIIAQAYSCSLVFFLALGSLGLGLPLMGSGDLINVGQQGLVLLGAERVPWHLLLAYGLSMVAMGTVASLAFLLGTFVENPIGPIVGAMALVVVLLAVSSLPMDLFDALRPWLFTSHFDIWQLALEDPVPWALVLKSLAVLLCYISLFTGGAFLVFCRRDILS